MLVLAVIKFDILSYVINLPHNGQPNVLVSFQIATELVLTTAMRHKCGINASLMVGTNVFYKGIL